MVSIRSIGDFSPTMVTSGFEYEGVLLASLTAADGTKCWQLQQNLLGSSLIFRDRDILGIAFLDKKGDPTADLRRWETEPSSLSAGTLYPWNEAVKSLTEEGESFPGEALRLYVQGGAPAVQVTYSQIIVGQPLPICPIPICPH